MSTAACNYDTLEPEIYELQTLPRSMNITRVRDTIICDNNNDLKVEPAWKGIMSNQIKPAHQEKKKNSLAGLKERFFGQKKDRKPSQHGSSTNKHPYLVPHTCYTHGHKLEPHKKSSWCDTCEELIWGLSIQAVRCRYCKYTCHSKCVSYVDLDCPKAPTIEKSTEDLTKETLEVLSVSPWGNNNMSENNNLPNFVTSINELRRMIDEYNDKSTLIMTLHNDCSFDGFIRVHMNLNRPVNIDTDVSNLTLKKAVAKHNKASRARARVSSNSFRRPVTEIFPDASGSISSSSYDSGVSSTSSTHSNDSEFYSPQHEAPRPLSPAESAVLSSMYSGRRKNLTRKLSFYMPKGTYKPLHVTSSTTVKEVIEALLSKYNITDNSKKFALFEKYKKKGLDEKNEVVYKHLNPVEKPLVLLLSWGANDTSRSFALKEDEGGDVRWTSFELPELENFLKILQMEEDQLMAQIIQKYENYRVALQNALESKNVTP